MSIRPIVSVGCQVVSTPVQCSRDRERRKNIQRERQELHYIIHICIWKDFRHSGTHTLSEKL